MSDNVTQLPKRGATWYGPSQTIDTAAYGQSVGVEGSQVRFNDVDPSDNMVLRSNRQVTCLLVRNVSGFTLLGKRLVSWAAGYRGKRVAGYCDVTAEEAAGVTDEFLGANGVRNGDLFYIAVAGPSLVKTPLEANGNNVFTEGGILYALTAATSGATTAGRVVQWAGTFSVGQTTDGGAANIIMNRVGRAMSAKTTANTNADILVDLEICKTAA
jgi:hypothetical protein